MTPLGSVATYSGRVAPDDLGPTLLHEHLFVRQPEVDRALPSPEWDEDAAVAEAVEQLNGLRDRGVRTIVDLTVPGLGRDARLVARVASAAPVRIVAATGWYAHGGLPSFFRLNGPGCTVDGPDPLIELFVRDLTEGIEGTGVRAGAIKVLSEADGITADHRRVFEAAAEARGAADVPVFTHADPTTRGGLEQLDVLGRLGVPNDRVVVGHVGDSGDVPYLRELAARGALLGFDRFGMAHSASDDARVRTLFAVLDAGLLDRVVLSHDAAIHSRMTPPSWRRAHTPDWHLHHLHDAILPRLRREGLGEDEIRAMLVDTPRRVLGGPAHEGDR